MIGVVRRNGNKTVAVSRGLLGGSGDISAGVGNQGNLSLGVFILLEKAVEHIW